MTQDTIEQQMQESVAASGDRTMEPPEDNTSVEESEPMIAPSEQEHEDDETREIADEITSMFTSACYALIERRDVAIKAAMKRLSAEQAKVSMESVPVAEALAEMKDRTPAISRVALADADRLLAEGKREEAESKRAEAFAAELALSRLESKMTELESAWFEIENRRADVQEAIRQKWAKKRVLPVLRAAENGYFLAFLARLEDGEKHDEVHSLHKCEDNSKVESVARDWYGITNTIFIRR